MSDARREVLLVDGMFCAACAASVEASLTRHPAVACAAVNFAAEAAVVEWREGTDRPVEALIDIIEKLGYRTRSLAAGSADTADQEGPGPSHRAEGPLRDLSLRLAVAVFFGMWTMLPSIGLYLDVSPEPEVLYGLALAAGLFSLPVVCYAGLPFYRMGMRTLRQGVAGIDALVALGVAGSLLLSVAALLQGRWEVYFEVPVALITLQLLARMIDLRLHRRARDAVTSLLHLAPAAVTLIEDDGGTRQVPLAEARAGASILLEPGQRSAVDGEVVDGTSLVDRSLLSGESAPVLVTVGDRLHAGETVLDGSLHVRVLAGAGGRRIDELARKVRWMLASRPPWQRLTDRLARHFLIGSAVAALLAFAIALGADEAVHAAGARALAVFVIACPCALSLAAPLAGLSACAAAAREGIVLRDLNAIAGAAVPSRLFTDKTGTLTEGKPTVVAVHSVDGLPEHDVLALAALAEQGAEHPLARAILDASRSAAAGPTIHGLTGGQDDPARLRAGEVRVEPGRGACWRATESTEAPRSVRAGSPAWFETLGMRIPAFPPARDTRVVVAADERVVGAIDLRDRLRAGAIEAVSRLQEAGIRITVLSGDGATPVERVARALGVDAHASMTPEDKARLIAAARDEGECVAFAGDGLNDSPALAAADLGIAVGGATDAARAAAAITLVDRHFSSLPAALSITRRARSIVFQNLAFAVAYNLFAIPAAMAGFVHPAVAAVTMAGSSISVALNAWRAGAAPQPRRRPPVLKAQGAVNRL